MVDCGHAGAGPAPSRTSCTHDKENTGQPEDTFTPAPGVRIAHATRIAPDIAEAHGQATSALVAAPATEAAPVSVKLGTLIGRTEIESAVVAWKFLLDPALFAPKNGVYDLGCINATYWTLRLGRSRYDEQSVSDL